MRSVKSLLVVTSLVVSALMSGCGPQPMERPQVDPQAPVNQVPGAPGTAPGGTPDGGTGLVPPGTPGAAAPGGGAPGVGGQWLESRKIGGTFGCKSKRPSDFT